ncbi:MAG: FHA domain-containing protein [Chloroflexi bacterium]|nr:FHA domain-containing protein [Chloroflexota bacterium]
MSHQPEGIAKLTWNDPATGERHEFVLVECASASIGRSPDNDICIPDRHVSRGHAVINFRNGVFTITDLGSANGTFVNDRKISGPYVLAHGDIIRLYVPVLHFSAIVSEEEVDRAFKTKTVILPAKGLARPRLLVTHGPQEGAEFILDKDTVTIGRVTADATWEITLNDRAISRPHCRLRFQNNTWTLQDLGSANGTLLNGQPVGATPLPLKDGDVITAGSTTMLFRLAAV